jgi:hypothetical protein
MHKIIGNGIYMRDFMCYFFSLWIFGQFGGGTNLKNGTLWMLLISSIIA